MKAKHTVEQLRAVVGQFALAGEYVDAVPYGTGHINDTYAVTVRRAGGVTARYIMQRINHFVFKQPDLLMANVERVTRHLRGQLERTAGADPERETLNLVPLKAGGFMYHSAEDEYWRIYLFIEGALTYDVIERPEQICEAARAFARFQQRVDDLPAPRLHETIPAFHDTPRRFAAFREALAADRHARAATCQPEIAAYLAREAEGGQVMAAMREGRIPERITHNDTKINNVMLDDATGRGVCVIDLDTVMPGSSLFDFGDMIRTAGGHFSESEKDLSKVYLDLAQFRQLVSGYLSVAREFLTPAELDLLAFSGRLLTLECGVRFLTDYLKGDEYFRTHYPGQNLDRCRTQLAFVQDMERHAAELAAIVAEYR